ncbi:MAG: alginate lyase family protein [Anaerolineae bacterium]
MSDFKSLIPLLDLDYPALAPVKARLAAGDEAGALAALIEHFRTRTSPTYLFDESDIAKFTDREVITEADEVMAHHIWGFDLGVEIDWHRNFTEDEARDPEWVWSMARQLYMVPLGRAYALTGDEKYAREWMAQLKSWSKAWPVGPYMEPLDPDMAFPGNHWRSIEAGMRMYCVWLPLLPYFRRSPSWDEEGWLVFLSGIHDHGEFLMTHFSNHKRCSNWLTMETTALFQVGVMFPEFKRAADWKQLGYRRLTHEVRYQFDHFGVHMERTPVYHLVAANAFLQGYRIATLNGIPVPPYMLPVLEQAAEYLMRLAKPDFSLPMVGDADRDSLLDRHADVSLYEGMNNSTDAIDLNEIRAFFRVMADITERKDFRWLATGRREGAPPVTHNFCMPDPGFHVLRSGWGPDDSFVMLSGTNLERGENRAHSHFDAAHMELQVRGQDILVDTGRFIYSNCAWQDWRNYFYSPNAHNTVAVDDHLVGTAPDTALNIRTVRTWLHRCDQSPEADLLEVSHNGYAYLEQPVFHLRRVLYVKPGVWLLDDVLTGMGEHEYRLHFNFAPGTLTPTTGLAYSYSRDGVTVSLTPLLADGLSAAVLEGMDEEGQRGGWVSYGYHKRVPAPQLTYTRQGAVPTRFLTAIVDQAHPAAVAISGKATGTLSVVVRGDGKEWRGTLG